MTSKSERTFGTATCGGRESIGAQGGSLLVVPSGDCEVHFINVRSPWPNDACVPTAGYDGGQPVAALPRVFPGIVIVDVPAQEGSTILEWRCVVASRDGGTPETLYEYEGDVDLLDPSGAAVDARTGRAVRDAIVHLETAPRGAPASAARASPRSGRRSTRRGRTARARSAGTSPQASGASRSRLSATCPTPARST